jgi:hypothetical protein
MKSSFKSGYFGGVLRFCVHFPPADLVDAVDYTLTIYPTHRMLYSRTTLRQTVTLTTVTLITCRPSDDNNLKSVLHRTRLLELLICQIIKNGL